MKKKRFTEEQISKVLKEPEAGVKVTDLSCLDGVSDTTGGCRKCSAAVIGQMDGLIRF